jgi:hypothetical protein
MSMIRDWFASIVAMITGWSCTFLFAFSGFDNMFGTNLVEWASDIPYMGLIFQHPGKVLIGVGLIFFLMYRGGALPKFIKGMFMKK